MLKTNFVTLVALILQEPLIVTKPLTPLTGEFPERARGEGGDPTVKVTG